MPRGRVQLGILLAATSVLTAVTLEKLAVEDMIVKSTEIVRGKVVLASPVKRGSIHYTQVTVQVAERFKGADNKVAMVSIPGGVIDGVRQTFPGTPELQIGQEYIFFLWTGKNGITHVIGLNQGVLDLRRDAQGNITAARAAIDANLFDEKGRPAASPAMEIPFDKLRLQIKQTLAARD